MRIPGILITCTILGFFIHLATAHYFNRLYPRCGYIHYGKDKSIRCFGGTTVLRPNSWIIGSTIYTLDLGSNIPIPLDTLSNNWQYVLSTNAFEAEIRGFCQIATLPNGYQIILQGGIDQNMFNDTILFDVSRKTWQRLTPYIPSNVGEELLQIYLQLLWILLVSLAAQQAFLTQDDTDSVPKVTGSPGFVNLTVFNTTSKTWSYFIPQNNVPSAIPIFHTATLDPRSGIIYYLGGEIIGTTEPSISQISWGYTFNTANGDWNTRYYTAPNGNFPSGRVYHTSTMG
ncbi:hypothetical protein RMCBS344292_19337 [Rhizopus microsporus]|nr:hypothetical protein RMCBS344292_19337 [Rhizopus microsporus]